MTKSAGRGTEKALSVIMRIQDFWGADLLAVHSVAIGEEEISTYARNHVSVSYNPIANMYLASGVAPVGEMLKAGITVAIGTDGAGSNNDNDMLEAMKFGALLQKTFHKDPLAMTAGECSEWPP